MADVAEQEVSIDLRPVQGIDNAIAQVADVFQSLIIIVEAEGPMLQTANERRKCARDERAMNDLAVGLVVLDRLIEVERSRVRERVPAHSSPFGVGLVILRWEGEVLRSQCCVRRCEDSRHETRAGVHDGAGWIVSVRGVIDLDAILGAGVVDERPGAKEELKGAEVDHVCEMSQAGSDTDCEAVVPRVLSMVEVSKDTTSY